MAESTDGRRVLVRGEDAQGGGEQRCAGGDGYLAGVRARLPFALATAVLGVSFGVLARSLGWGVVAPIVFSVVTLSGSAQFALIVWGRHEIFFTVQAAEAYKRDLPEAEVHILDAGHWALETHTPEVIDLVRDFFIRHLAG